MKKERIEWLDIAKGIGILLVILGHAYQGVVSSSHLKFPNSVWIIKQVIYSFHMPLFFIVSGWFIDNWLKNKPKIAFKKRIPLVTTYFFWTILTGLCMQIASKWTNSGMGIREVLLSPIIPFSQYWYLYVLIVYQLLLYLLNHVFKFSRKAILLLSIFMFIIHPFVADFWILKNLTKYFIFIAIGYLGKEYITSFIEQQKYFFSTLIISFISLTAYLLLLVRGVKYSSYMFFITSISISYLVLLLAYLVQGKKNMIERQLKFLGLKSLLFYVSHLIPLAAARILLEKVLHVTNHNIVIWLSFIIAIFLCYLLSYIVKFIADRNNYLRALFRYIA